MSYKDYITTVYVNLYDILKLIGHKHKTNKPKFSDSELITLLIYASTFKKGEIKSTIKEFKKTTVIISLCATTTCNCKKSKKFIKITIHKVLYFSN